VRVEGTKNSDASSCAALQRNWATLQQERPKSNRSSLTRGGFYALKDSIKKEAQKQEEAAKETLRTREVDLLEQTKEQPTNEAEGLKQHAAETINRKAGEIVQKGTEQLKGKA